MPSVCHCFGARRDAADDGGRSLSGRAAGEAASEADGEDAAQAVRAAAQEDAGGNQGAGGGAAAGRLVRSTCTRTKVMTAEIETVVAALRGPLCAGEALSLKP